MAFEQFCTLTIIIQILGAITYYGVSKVTGKVK